MSKPKLLPPKIFLQTFKYAPRPSVNVVVENGKGEILLARRAIPPRAGVWHLPGGFILKGERIQECLVRVLKKELGLKVDPKKAVLLGAFDDLHNDPRGHIVDLIYKLTVTKSPKLTVETKEWKFFRKLPKGIGFKQGATLKKLGY